VTRESFGRSGQNFESFVVECCDVFVGDERVAAVVEVDLDRDVLAADSGRFAAQHPHLGDALRVLIDDHLDSHGYTFASQRVQRPRVSVAVPVFVFGSWCPKTLQSSCRKNLAMV
jgi:hypothetical protein